MSSKAGRIAVLVAFVAIAAVLFVALRDDDGGGGTQETSEQTTSDPAATPTAPPQPQPEVIVMRDGAPVGGVAELTYRTGEQVLIKVKLDQPQEDIHIHGYEIEKLNPSGTVSFDFKADIEGIFELEAHGPNGDVPLADIRVEPA